MDASDIIAIIALIISAAVALYDIFVAKRANRTNLNSYYFNEIYREHLIHKIPDSRKYIKINLDGKLVGYNKIVQEMKVIQVDSLYYKYVDKKYYEKLVRQAQKIEDFVIAATAKHYNGEEQTDFWNELKKELSELYRILNDKYLNE